MGEWWVNAETSTALLNLVRLGGLLTLNTQSVGVYPEMFLVNSEVINAILTFILFDHYLLSYLLVDRNYLLSHLLVDCNYLLSHLAEQWVNGG